MNVSMQKLLDSYIHDYLVKKKMKATADIFALEAHLQLGPLFVDDSEEGFLAEWWSILWDVYSSSLNNDPQSTITEFAAADASGGSVAQNAPAGSSGGGPMAKTFSKPPMPPLNPTQMALPTPAMGNDNFVDFTTNEFDFVELVKSILEGMPTAAVNELASNSEVLILRDLAAQMMNEKAGTFNADMGSGERGV